MLSYPVPLLILVALQTIEAFVLHNKPSSSPNAPELISRAEEHAILETYTGNGAP